MKVEKFEIVGVTAGVVVCAFMAIFCIFYGYWLCAIGDMFLFVAAAISFGCVIKYRKSENAPKYPKQIFYTQAMFSAVGIILEISALIQTFSRPL